MASTTRSFSFIPLFCPSSSPSPYSLPASSKSRSKQPKYPRKARSKPKSKRNGPEEQELLTEAFQRERNEECPCPSCTYPDVDSGGNVSPSSRTTTSSSSFDNHDMNSDENLNIARVENRGIFLEPRKRGGGSELNMKWGLAWWRGRRTRGRGYGYGYEYAEINTYAGVS